VKSITHQHRRPVDPRLLSLLQTSVDAHLLPKLTAVQIGVSSWDALSMAMGLSSKLQHLTLDLGFNKARTDVKGVSNDVAAAYLEKVAHTAFPRRLEIRGMALGHKRIDFALTSMKSLRVLSLTTGKSLTENTLAMIATFPYLGELEIHAGHIDADELAASMTMQGTPLFPALKMLHIRAQPPLVELFIQKIPHDNLRRLIIEAERPALPALEWASAFRLIPAKATNTLSELTIEHHIDSVTEMHLIANNTPSQLNSGTQFTIGALRPLAKLPHLRRLVLDTTVVPGLCDAEIEEVAKWWPLLEHLDLGGLFSDVNCSGHLQKPQASLKCLEILSRLSPKLETLVINLDINFQTVCDAEPGNARQQAPHPLRYLTIGSISAPDPLQLSPYLSKLFPSLIEIDGVIAHEQEWRAVQSMLQSYAET
jgi:hypothetical protein